MCDSILNVFPTNPSILELGETSQGHIWHLERSKEDGSLNLHPRISPTSTGLSKLPIVGFSPESREAYLERQGFLHLFNLDTLESRSLRRGSSFRTIRSLGKVYAVGFNPSDRSINLINKETGHQHVVLNFDITPMNMAEIVVPRLRPETLLCCLETKENYSTDLNIYSQCYWQIADVEQQVITGTLRRQDSKFYTNLQLFDENLAVVGSHQYSTNSESLDLFDLRRPHATVSRLLDSRGQVSETHLSKSKKMGDWGILNINESGYMKTNLYLTDIRKPGRSVWTSRQFKKLTGIFPSRNPGQTYLTEMVKEPGCKLTTQLIKLELQAF